MKKWLCNPLNLAYRYQVKRSLMGAGVFREAADPTVALFRGTYYLFASMSGGFWYSDDLYDWKFKETPELPVYDYAPDVREVDGRLIFSASRRGRACTFYSSADPLREPFQAVSAPFGFWDPNLFWDDDGRVYFYWGCSNRTPIYGLELDPLTLLPMGEKVSLFGENMAEHGWERAGDNNRPADPRSGFDRVFRLMLGAKPFIEGAFMTKRAGRYYLQYAAPGTEYNIYSDGVYVGEGPLGPFVYQPHNPFSSKPGGFITGAGHGSTFQDKAGNWWHISTMRVSVNENFERRIGLFPCDFDADGLLYCNQNFADYPFALPDGKRTGMDATAPAWMLLSYNNTATASSSLPGFEPARALNENIRDWWAADAGAGAWFELDLGEEKQVRAVQINFADHRQPMQRRAKGELHRDGMGRRFIHIKPPRTAFLLESSADGIDWITVKDSRGDETDLAHDFIVFERETNLRYLRVSEMELPFGGRPAISGLRVFGSGGGAAPAPVRQVQAERRGDCSIRLRWAAVENADGYNLRYGIAPDKLYASWQLFGANELDLGMINAGQTYYIAVDSFNENGVTAGSVVEVR